MAGTPEQNQEKQTYPEAVSAFNEMVPPYSASEMLEKITTVHSIGTISGITHRTLFADLQSLAGEAVDRAKTIPDEDAAKRFEGMQTGYASILRRLSPETIAPTPTPRSRTGQAAG